MVADKLQNSFSTDKVDREGEKKKAKNGKKCAGRGAEQSVVAPSHQSL